ncbi:MAG: 50S ribosomal protein L21 [Bdellovibrionales bacterium]|nr:50S ribosomal protein L21 [Bdellovibrionales bacterium]
MYAVIQTGGKQYKVQPGEVVQVEKLEGEIGTATKFSNVLLVAKPGTDATTIWLGKPMLNGAVVDAEIVGQGRGHKEIIVKMKRRKQYRRTQGHRQELTQLLVLGVSNGSGEKLELSASDKKAKLDAFTSHLKAKGPAFSPKRLGSRKKLGAKIVAENKAGGSSESAKKPTAKKTTKKA